MHKNCAFLFFYPYYSILYNGKLKGAVSGGVVLKTMSKIKIIACIPAFLLVIFGICYFFCGLKMPFNILYYFLSAVFLGYGVIKLLCYFSKDMYQLAFQFDFGMGIFFFVMGLLFSCFEQVMLKNFLGMIGFTVFIDAVLKIQTSLEAKRFGLGKWWIILILAVFSALAAALFFVVQPIERLYRYGLINFADIIHIIGLTLFLEGCLNLWVVIYTVKEAK